MPADILGLPGLQPVDVRVDEQGIRRIKVEGVHALLQCPDCKSPRLHGHGTQSQSFADCPHAGQVTIIDIDRKRYRCQSCTKTHFQPLEAVDGKRLATKRLVQYIEQRCLKSTFLALANDVGLDDKTIRGVFDDYVARVQQAVPFVVPEVLGIDEIKIIGDYRAVITNVERNTLYDMLPSRKKTALIEYFTNLPQKKNVRWVVMDMWNVYRQVAQKCLPHAKIVVDKFHIQRMANEAMEVTRKKVRKGLSTRQRLKLKDDRFVLLKRLHNLSAEQYATLKGWVDEFPELGQVHALKEGFYSVWDFEDRTSAEDAYDRWLASVPDEMRRGVFRLLIQAMQSWHTEVFNYFDKPVTNAYTESVNNLIKTTNRMGRGYSFEVIRARMLYNQKALKDGSQVVLEPVSERPTMSDGFVGWSAWQAPQQVQRVAKRVVYYGAYIPTLVKQLEEGYFEKP